MNMAQILNYCLICINSRNQAEYILTELGLVELWVSERKRLERAPTSIRDKFQQSIPNEVNEDILSNTPNLVNKVKTVVQFHHEK